MAPTANALQENFNACHEAGMDEILTKAVILGRIQEVVRRLLADR